MATVTFNMSAFNRFLGRSVQPYLEQKAREIAEEARINAPTGATGDLKSSINVERTGKNGVRVHVTAEHAGFVHQGTGPGHIPSPRNTYFPSVRKRGLVVWAAGKGANPYKVAHGISQKGTPANPFLADAIEKVLGKNNFRWIKKDVIET